MLGSVADAEDMLQDAFVRWQETFNTQIGSPKAFLVTIISRLRINHLQSARVRREEYFGQWLPEPLLTMPASDPFAATAIDESPFYGIPFASGAADSRRASRLPLRALIGLS